MHVLGFVLVDEPTKEAVEKVLEPVIKYEIYDHFEYGGGWHGCLKEGWNPDKDVNEDIFEDNYCLSKDFPIDILDGEQEVNIAQEGYIDLKEGLQKYKYVVAVDLHC